MENYLLEVYKRKIESTSRMRSYIEKKLKLLNIQHYDVFYHKPRSTSYRGSLGCAIMIMQVSPETFKKLVKFCEEKWEVSFWRIQLLDNIDDLRKSSPEKSAIQEIKNILSRKWNKKEMMLLEDPYENSIRMIEEVVRCL